tara:strand:+ start:14766 stop:15125 length:360 start_codon:yes stop_codon:yes gene_type:complete
MAEYFYREEFACQYTGENKIKDEFIERLDKLRKACGFPFIITSGYRSPSHPIEAKKKVAGQHSQGNAADIKVSDGLQRYKLVAQAIALGFTGIGVASTFIHVDTRDLHDDAVGPVMWTY